MVSILVDMGADSGGASVEIDLEELLATRLLVQGNSGSGKSYLLRRLLEGSAEHVQQIVIDPEGDFATLSEAFGHNVVDAARYSLAEIATIAARARAHRLSVVLCLDNLEVEQQMRCAATFSGALFDAPRDHWYPALVVVDEAQLFAPSAAGEVSDEVRRLSLAAMTNLMCRGRKRGLAGVIATQRLAKLAKNVAAEASNFLMGRTFLDIDMARAADLLGMERRQAEQIRDLQRGHFLALGPAISRRPISVRIGAVRTQARSASPKLVPLPTTADAQGLLFAPTAEEVARPEPVAEPEDDRVRSLLDDAPPPPPVVAPATIEPDEREAIVEEALAAIAADPAAAARSPAALYQDFLLRCRMRRLGAPALDLAAFRRRLGMAQAGIFAHDEVDWAEALGVAATLPDDMLGVFLAIARAARDEQACPSDIDLATLYGTSSASRARRLLAYMEEQGAIVVRIDLSGRRSIAVPALGWTTASSEIQPEPRARTASRR